MRLNRHGGQLKDGYNCSLLLGTRGFLSNHSEDSGRKLVVEYYCQSEGCGIVGTNGRTISLFAEETIMNMIFTECDTEGTGKVPALKLMRYMLSNADQKLDRWVNGQNV